jgi:uncharacterized protein YeaO (DUF488 family)
MEKRFMAKTIKVKRIYEAPADSDGTRILVDRLWPRGIAKAKAKVDLWLKDIAPSDALRKRFHGHPEDWDEFRKAYAAELKQAGEAVKELRGHMRKGTVTLLYAARDEEHNNAVALKRWVGRRSK